MHAATSTPALAELFRRVADAARRAGVFAAVNAAESSIECDAKDSGAPAHYSLFLAPDRAGHPRLWGALITADRWLSQSIEQDLVHTGDKLNELMDEELADQGHGAASGAGRSEPFEHFRDEDKRFVFRTPLPVDPAHLSAGNLDSAALVASRFLLALEAMFRPLGDMSAADD